MRLTRRGKWIIALGIVAFLVIVPLVGVNIYLRSVGVWGESDPGKAVSFEIPRGSSPREVGNILAEEGVIKSSTGWRIMLFLDGGAEGIQAGRYELPIGLTARDALAALLESGPLGPDFVTVTFPEGSWLTDFARIVGDKTHISSKAFTRVLESGAVTSELLPEGVGTFEGLLFPSTYQVIEDETAEGLVKRLLGEMEKQVAGVDMTEAESLNLTPYEVLIVASMIEAETRVDDERPMVARVIYNRLRDGIPLGIDATVLYAIGEHKEELTQSDLQVDSPYNTRVVQGLPPTPIGAPGLASIQAAAAPADGDWLYYVLADCEGNHAFSESYDEFLQNKAAYQQLEC